MQPTMESVCTTSDFGLVAAWRQHLEAQDLSPATIRMYSSAITRFGTEVVRGPILSATEDDVDVFMVSLGRRARRSLAARGLRSFYCWAQRRGHIDSDPTSELRKIQSPRAKPQVILEPDELTRVIFAAASRHPRRAWALVLMYSLGCRRAELVGIAPWDLLGDRVRLRCTKGGRERHVELNALASMAIEQLRPWWTKDSVLGGIAASTITGWAKEAALDAGLYEKVSRRPSHVLRASFATHLLREGIPIHVVKDLLGHRSIETTQVYLVATDPDRRRAVQKLPFAAA